MNVLEEIIRKKLRLENRKIDKANARLAIEKNQDKIDEIKTTIARLDGKCEAYIEVLKMIIAPQPVGE